MDLCISITQSNTSVPNNLNNKNLEVKTLGKKLQKDEKKKKSSILDLF